MKQCVPVHRQNVRSLRIVPGDRKALIEMANQALKINPKLMVILANQAGDIICMTRSGDANKALKDILERDSTNALAREADATIQELLEALKQVHPAHAATDVPCSACAAIAKAEGRKS